MKKMFDDEMHSALQQLMDETIEALQLAKVSPDPDDLGATFAVADRKIRQPGQHDARIRPRSTQRGRNGASAGGTTAQCRAARDRLDFRRH